MIVIGSQLPNIALKTAPSGRLDVPQAARHLAQRYVSPSQRSSMYGEFAWHAVNW